MAEGTQSGFMTIREVLDYLGIKRGTLDLYVRQGRLTRYQQGAPKKTVYRRSAVEALKKVHPK